MIKKIWHKTLIASIMVLISSSAYAAGGYVGILGGGNIANVANTFESDSNTKTTPAIGVKVGAKIIPELGLGFYGSYVSQSNSTSVFVLTAGTKTKTYYLTGEVNFFLLIFHAGVNLGVAITTWSADFENVTTSSSNTALVYGPEVGFDIPIIPNLVSLGGEAHYLLTSKSDGVNNLQVLGAVKVWF